MFKCAVCHEEGVYDDAELCRDCDRHVHPWCLFTTERGDTALCKDCGGSVPVDEDHDKGEEKKEPC